MLHINTGVYTYLISGAPNKIVRELEMLYPGAISYSKQSADYQIDISQTSLLRKLLRPQVSLKIDGHQPFNPIPPSKLLPSIEWAMNWCIAAYDHTHLLIHCSVVEKNGKVILFPASSGSGKSTTSSYLALHGWNLFFDEMAVIDLGTGLVNPIFRPSSLKNDSIKIVKSFSKDAHISALTQNTHKGEIAHLRPHSFKQFSSFKACEVSAVVFLDYQAKKETSIYEVNKSIGFAKLVSNAFNYSVIGERAFDTLVTIANRAECFEIAYSKLDEVAEFLEEVIDEK